MAKFYSYPHYKINVKDESLRFPLVTEELALHRPLFLSFAERGPIGVPVYGGYDELISQFGKGTLDRYSKYFRHPNLFLEKCLQYNKVFFVRVASEGTGTASMVLQCSVTPTAKMPQYQKIKTLAGVDTGVRAKDGFGEWIPVLTDPMDPSSDPVVEPGLVIEWSIRQIHRNIMMRLFSDSECRLPITRFVTGTTVYCKIIAPLSPGILVTYALSSPGTSNPLTITPSPADGEGVFKIVVAGSSLVDGVTLNAIATIGANSPSTVSMDVIVGAQYAAVPDILIQTTNDQIEDYNNVQISSATVEDPYDSTVNVTKITYPVVAFEAFSAGEWGNNRGFRFFWDHDSNKSAAERMQALIFSFGIVDTPWGLDNALPVRTFYLDETTPFCFKPDTTDKSTGRRFFLEEVIKEDYQNEDVTFKYHVYHENMEAVGTGCMTVEPNTGIDVPVYFDELTSPFMFNLFTGQTLDQQYYDHVEVKDGSVNMDPTYSYVDPDTNLLMYDNVDHFMSGGADGDTSNTNLEELTREWLTGIPFPDIEDKARYPITHVYDSGYTLNTKSFMLDFMGIRDDIKVILSTQALWDEEYVNTSHVKVPEVRRMPNSKAEDQSSGGILRQQSLMRMESYIYGTRACRVTILQQCGRLNDQTVWPWIVPATLDCMEKKGLWQGAVYMKGKPKGLPRSAVTCLKDISWFPVSADHKQKSWDTAINYMQYYDMTSFHYPDVISVYPYNTSLLSDDIFTDMLIYIKHIVRFQWSKFAGVDDPLSRLIANIKESMSKDIYSKLGGHIRAEVNPYQTELDAELGYALTVEVAVYGTVPNRVWNVIIPVRREIVTT